MIVLATALVVGCSSDPTRGVQMAFVSTKNLNLDEAGGSLPVMVRVYQLRQKDGFEQASFDSLWKSDKELLGSDLVERKDLTLSPNTEMLVDIDVDLRGGTRYLAIMALYRKPEGNAWRTVIFADDVSTLIPFATPSVRLVFDRNSVSLQR